MKQYTLRQIQDLPLGEKLDFLKSPRELGVKTAGPKGEFEVKGVYLPMSEYNKLKGDDIAVDDLSGNSLSEISGKVDRFIGGSDE